MKVVFWPYLAKAEMLARFAKHSIIELVQVDNADALGAAIRDVEVLVISQTTYDAKVAAVLRENANQLKFIQLMNAGYDGPLKHGVPVGVKVAKSGDAWSPALAEHVLTLLLASLKNVPAILANHAKHGWDRSFTARMDAIDGKTMAIIGYGSIGREVAIRAKPFGMHIIGVSRGAGMKPHADECAAIADLSKVLARADVIVLTAPQTAQTKHLFNEKTFATCKKGAVLINVARGGLIDQMALVDALKSGVIGAAGLDVTDPEPLAPEHPLWDAPNCIISPHVAGSSGAKGRERLADFVVENTVRYVNGQSVTHIVPL